MRILITNDDGIYSPGIAVLAEVVPKFGGVRIVAPDAEQSSAEHSITAMRPLSYKRTPIGNFDAYRVNGTPADCVALELTTGKNGRRPVGNQSTGSNLGNAMWHSRATQCVSRSDDQSEDNRNIAAFLRERSLTSFSRIKDICISLDFELGGLIGIGKACDEDYPR